jgi:hypothetical protein
MRHMYAGYRNDCSVSAVETALSQRARPILARLVNSARPGIRGDVKGRSNARHKPTDRVHVGPSARIQDACLASHHAVRHARTRPHIKAALRRHNQQMRRLESPFFECDQAILRAFGEDGRSVPELAHQYGISGTRAREILRVQRIPSSERFSPHLTQPPTRGLPHRTLPDLPGEIPQTVSMMKDP